MKDFTKVREAIEGLISSANLGVPVVFENTKNRSLNEPHIEVFEASGSSASAGMGETVYLVSGLITVSIFTENGAGTNAARLLASSISDLFENNPIEGMAFNEPELFSVGETTGSNLYQHNLLIKHSYFYGQVENQC